MILIEICAVLCVILLFAILTRLVDACNLLREFKNLITNPNIVVSEDMIKRIIELWNAKRHKSKSSRS